MIGIGTDLVDLDRFRDALERTPGLVSRLFSPAEQAYAERLRDPTERYAARFAAKEALAKALGAPVGLSWMDVTVHRASDGRPHLMVRGSVQDEIDRQGIATLHVSLSHDAGVASAVVVAEGVS